MMEVSLFPQCREKDKMKDGQYKATVECGDIFEGITIRERAPRNRIREA